MKSKWYDFKGVAVFDHEENRFWNRQEIRELALEFWNDADMPTKNPTEEELISMFKEEFDAFTDKETYELSYWDDLGRWELVDLPIYFGFGIMSEEGLRFKELVKEVKQ
jgi:hypothetical protein